MSAACQIYFVYFFSYIFLYLLLLFMKWQKVNTPNLNCTTNYLSLLALSQFNHDTSTNTIATKK